MVYASYKTWFQTNFRDESVWYESVTLQKMDHFPKLPWEISSISIEQNEVKCPSLHVKRTIFFVINCQIIWNIEEKPKKRKKFDAVGEHI